MENWSHKELKEMKMTWIISPDNIIQCIPTKLVNLFDIGEARGRKDATDQYCHWDSCIFEVSESFVSAKEQGEKTMGEFVQARLISDKANFWKQHQNLSKSEQTY